jgi:hypothetical protein
VQWAGQLNQRQIAAVRQRDRIDVKRHAAGKSIFNQLADVLRRWFK